MPTTRTNTSFEAIARRAVLRSSVPVLDGKALGFVREARLTDAASRLTAARTHRATRRRFEIANGRAGLAWAAGSAA